MGWSNFLHNFLSGGDRTVSDPAMGGGFFKPGSVGAGWGDYLKDLYKTPTGESAQFRTQSTALRDALSMESEGQKDEFSAAASGGGFYDSGARLTGLNQINRSRMANFSQGLAQILGRLEEEKMQAAFPFLQAQQGGFTAYQNAMLGEENAGNYRANAHASAVVGGFTGAMGGGGGGGGYTG